MQGKEVTETNTRHRIYGRGKGFPRMYNGHPCVLDAIEIKTRIFIVILAPKFIWIN